MLRIPGRTPTAFGMSGRQRSGVALLAGGLIALHILLPLDRGFPAPVLFGKPVSLSILASIAVLVVYLLASRRALVTAVSHRYCAIMAAFVAILMQASLRAPSAVAMTAMHSTVAFACMFVVNFALFRYAVMCGGRTIVVRSAVVVSIAAAAIGIAQSLLGVTIPAYSDWYLNYYQMPMPDATLANVRAYGTLNQPILFGTALMLSIPFLMELRSTILRYSGIAIVCIAAVLTGSRTILIVAGVFGVGSLIVYKARSIFTFGLAAVVSVLVIQVTDVGLNLESAARVPFLMSRLGIGTDLVASTAADNIQVRQIAVGLAVDEIVGETDPLLIALGRGRTTGSNIGAQIARDYATLDNAFVTVLYEEGALGLFFFCAAFAVFLYQSRAASRVSLHWYSTLALLGVGISFNFEAYSTVNVLVAASMALASLSSGPGVAVKRGPVMRASVLGHTNPVTPKHAASPAAGPAHHSSPNLVGSESLRDATGVAGGSARRFKQ